MTENPQILLPQHKSLLNESGISEEIANARGYRSVQVKAELERLGFARAQRNAPGLLVPVYGVTGEIVTYQFRPDSPRVNSDGKAVKYETPGKSRMEMDIPPSVREKLGDPSIPLFITEGVRKADSAVSIRLCCIALLGVWNWRGTNELGGKTALPAWESIALNNRKVYIVFDSDVIVKSQVRAALLRLKKFLESRKANVLIIYLPAGEGGAKTGLDDYLAAGHSVDELLAHATDELRGATEENENRVGPYLEKGGAICLEKDTRDGPIITPLCNFTARIVQENVIDDGIEQKMNFAIEGVFREKPLSRIEVSAAGYPGMGWVNQNWGTAPVVYAGFTTKDNLRVGIQLLSGEVPKRTIFSHLGWRCVEGKWFYIHAGGAIGERGSAGDIFVAPGDGRLSCYTLPDPPLGDQIIDAVKRSLQLLQLAPPTIIFPLYAGVCRATLGEVLPTDLSIFIAGPTGCQKTELTALAQAHWGPEFNGKNLPGNWNSTANSLEKQAFLTKDSIFTIDDFAPGGTTYDIQRLHRDADRILRAQGNRGGRGRMRADGSLRPEYFPRGLILSSGEDIPRGQSLRARMLILELSPGDVDLSLLTCAQKDAAHGIYSQAMAGYVQWLSPRIELLKQSLPSRHEELRGEARRGKFNHDRTPDIVGSLSLGWETFLKFAQEVGAISEEEKTTLWQQAWQALSIAADSQSVHMGSEEPTSRFLMLLRAAIASGHAHVADSKSERNPPAPIQWGWRERSFEIGEVEETEWREHGDRVGWLEDEDLLLDPEAAYAVAQKMARDQGTSISVTQQTLWKRMREKGLLASTEKDRNLQKWTIGERRLRVLHLKSTILFPKIGTIGTQEPVSPDSVDLSPENMSRIFKDDPNTGQKNGTKGLPSKGSAPSVPIVPKNQEIGPSFKNSSGNDPRIVNADEMRARVNDKDHSSINVPALKDGLLPRRDSLNSSISNPNEVNYRLVDSFSDILKNKPEVISLDIETTGLYWWEPSAKVVSVGVSAEPGKVDILLVEHNSTDQKIRKNAWKEIKKVLTGVPIVTQNGGQFDIPWLLQFGMPCPTKWMFDLLIASKLRDENLADGHSLQSLIKNYLPPECFSMYQDAEKLAGKVRDSGNFHSADPELIKKYCGCDADLTLRLALEFKEWLKEDETHGGRIRPLLDKLEMPLAKLISESHRVGVRIDREAAQRWSSELESECGALQAEFHEIVGAAPNNIGKISLTAPAYLIWALHKKLGIKWPKGALTAKGQLSTKIEILNRLRPQNREQRRVIEVVIEFREKSKLNSTYAKKISRFLDSNDTAHPSWQQARVKTGRISATDPPIQTFPAPPSYARRVIIPDRPDHILGQIDVSNAELRIAAHVSQDEKMIEAFQSGTSIHVSTCADLFFGGDRNEVNKETPEYKAAKAVNCGIIYGISPFGLHLQLEKIELGKFSEEDCEQLIKNLFGSWPGFASWMEQTQKFTLQNGYVLSPIGRVRRLPDAKSSDLKLKSRALRQAVNSIIQGFSSDIVSHSACVVREELKVPIRILNHDSIVMYLPKRRAKAMLKKAADIFRDPPIQKVFDFKLLVPFETEGGIGPSWGEIEEVDL